MNDWEQRLRRDLEPILRSDDPRPQISAYHDMPYAIFRYPPEEEFAVRQEVTLLKTRLEQRGKLVTSISLSEQSEDWHIHGSQTFLTVGDLPVVNYGCVKFVRKQHGGVQRPPAAETPAQRSDSGRLPGINQKLVRLADVFVSQFRILNDTNHQCPRAGNIGGGRSTVKINR